MKRNIILLLLAGLMPVHAGSPVKIVDSWEAPEAKTTKFHKVIAVVVTRIPETRRIGEAELTRVMSTPTTTVSPSSLLLTQAELETPEAAKAKVAANGIDGAIVFRLHSFGNSERATPTAPRVAVAGASPTSFYGASKAPAETFNEFVVEVETLVFSLKDDKLMWSSITRAKNPLSAQKVIQEMTQELAKRMKKVGMFSK